MWWRVAAARPDLIRGFVNVNAIYPGYLSAYQDRAEDRQAIAYLGEVLHPLQNPYFEVESRPLLFGAVFASAFDATRAPTYLPLYLAAWSDQTNGGGVGPLDGLYASTGWYAANLVQEQTTVNGEAQTRYRFIDEFAASTPAQVSAPTVVAWGDKDPNWLASVPEDMLGKGSSPIPGYTPPVVHLKAIEHLDCAHFVPHEIRQSWRRSSRSSRPTRRDTPRRRDPRTGEGSPPAMR